MSDRPRSGSAPAVLLVVYEGIAGNDVVKSQVVGLALELAALGAPVRILVFERVDRFVRGRREALRTVRAHPGTSLEIRLVPRLHGSLGLRLARACAGLILRGFTGVVHCRGMKAVYVATPPSGARSYAVIGDFRGAEPEEAVDLLERGLRPERGMGELGARELYGRLGTIESAAVSACDRLLCVSQPLREHLAVKYGIADERITVVHCGAPRDFEFREAARKRVRIELECEGAFVVCYLGGLTPVHRPDLLSAAVRSIARVSDHRPVFLALTRDAEALAALAAHVTRGVRVIHRCVDPKDVPDYLAAADVGLLMLDDALRNNVSFPVKFSEYACCGLPVITTRHATDPARYVSASGMGAVVDESGFDVIFPPAEDLSRAVRRIAAVRGSERLSYGESSARLMRFDYTAERILSVYREGLAQSRP